MLKPLRTTSLVLLSALAHASVLAAQESAGRHAGRLQPGARVRIGTSSGVKHEGMLVSLSRDSVSLITYNNSPVRYHREDLVRFDVSVERSHPLLKGTLIGAGAGAVAGAVFPLGSRTKCKSDSQFCTAAPVQSADNSRSGAIIGATTAGAVLGLLIGTQSTEKWVSVRQFTGLNRTPNGVGLSLSF